VLQEHDFLVDGRGIVEKVVVRDEFSRPFLLVFCLSFLPLVLVTFNIVEVE